MEIIPFGKTGLKVSVMGLGLAALGRPGYINLGHGEDLNADYSMGQMQHNTSKVLEKAYGLGIRYFDVARSYGNAEQFFSNWRNKNPGYKDLVLGSKWGYVYTAGWQVQAEKHEIKEHSLALLDKQWRESNAVLERHPDIYHIHSATLESGVLENQAVLSRLWQLKESGTIIGLSVSGPEQGRTLEKALNISASGGLLFQSIQVTWNVLEQSATGVLKEAAQRGCGIIVKECLANGRLTSRNNGPDQHEKIKLLQSLSQKYKVGIDAIALAFVLKQSWVSVALSGACTEAQLLSNLQAEDVHLNEEESLLLSSMAETPAVYWKKRTELDWN